MKKMIAPSLLSANFLDLGKEIEMINKSEADWMHLDVMDGVFVPNISFGLPVVHAISKQSEKPLDVHLMIVNPDRYILPFRDAGAHILSVHYEACTHLHRCLQQIREAGMKAGVVLNPHTNVSLLEDVLPYADMVLIMSVNPGFGGQEFIPQTMRKIEKLRLMIDKIAPEVLIEVDGGVNTDNAGTLFSAGADVLVAGNAVFKSANPTATIQALKK
ncbi:MAG: ribulose-phosphate 3-epimerase [Bacteroidetes bacterium]|nr:ribulose-phosphate 3-epimerase [Bacteroidota bacterium]MBU1579996.1 ribulose-phosphate 3-epimerase [Bacteroidota bacterium]MBU2465163.1 ribulose-phosphate 3-epimerase [Bacteroidota bacterium]MBU2559027.1 ribulose-phosphate 3-epimerase [Bacteroidota bacterium]